MEMGASVGERDRDVGDAGGPVLVGANWYRFRAGEHIHHDLVESVSFVWVVQGAGVITSAGESFALTTNSILRLPWRHDVDYRPDDHSPFHVGTIHLVPWHDSTVPVVPRVGVRSGDPLLGAPWRRGPERPERPVLRSSRSTTARSLIALASYGVERFLAERTDEPCLRSLGTLIADESSGWTGSEPVARGVPAVLELMIDHILANIDRHLPVSEIAEAGKCSPTTAERLFARYTGLSVVAWSRRRRMQEAALLLRTSGLRVNEVARRVGYADPLYFSRVFTSVHDVPPSRYASGQLRP
ncbi:helix-turn-helix transcriptional regulator [Lacisediminihabitans sp.]|uniref:helix-turn-helix transcriptional regulator n=1 Tax=Lacisediminihabitans sp. TaxID=2787631 RepID=UPI00374CED70